MTPRATDPADLLAVVARRLHRRTLTALEPSGVTTAQVRVLRVLSRSGGPVRMGLLAERLEMAPRSATSLVDPLVERGLVVRSADPDDRRATAVSLTDAGRAVLTGARAVRRRVADDLLGVLSADERDELGRLLRRVVDARV